MSTVLRTYNALPLTFHATSNKAVADGAISFHVDHFVSARVSKFAYGTNVRTPYDPENPEHLARSARCSRDLTGALMIGGLFDVILPRVSLDTVTAQVTAHCPLIRVQP